MPEGHFRIASEPFCRQVEQIVVIQVDEDIARYVLEHCPARNDRALMERFGISYNTLRKIEARSPIRRSVADRLGRRLRAEREGRAPTEHMKEAIASA